MALGTFFVKLDKRFNLQAEGDYVYSHLFHLTFFRYQLVVSMSDDVYESSQEDELSKKNRLESFLENESQRDNDSLSLSLRTEAVESFLCTSPSGVIPHITSSELARK